MSHYKNVKINLINHSCFWNLKRESQNTINSIFQVSSDFSLSSKLWASSGCLMESSSNTAKTSCNNKNCSHKITKNNSEEAFTFETFDLAYYMLPIDFLQDISDGEMYISSPKYKPGKEVIWEASMLIKTGTFRSFSHHMIYFQSRPLIFWLLGFIFFGISWQFIFHVVFLKEDLLSYLNQWKSYRILLFAFTI